MPRRRKPAYPLPPAHHPSRQSYQTSPIPHKPKKRRRSALKIFYSVLYQFTFYFFIILIGSLLIGSAYGLGQQAVRTGGQRRWNMFVLVAAYVALALVSIVHVWSRIISVKKILRSMPKPYMPTKQIDVPKVGCCSSHPSCRYRAKRSQKVADHIMTEYSRTAVIAHISQATTGQQEGWGRPGTRWENQHFRTYIMSTLPMMREALCPHARAPPLSLAPLVSAANDINDSGAIKLFVNSYVKMIDRARYAKQEPTEGDASACEKLVEIVLLTLQMRRQREEREKNHARPEQEAGKVSP
ncbi:hypothetical protein DB88DRAFT_258962 [Papiliotrema laurentii]|uniref:Defect at low temperature protein 1 n=1 Tax=Papiliotrema laurentii TaxID=5418 RepID=A0AAD9FQN4_PAPLA|nr:hypothetical protein DB88DRAFT_258962 [Papiliotrema laurentii]